MIQFACPDCEAKYQAPPDFAGRTLRCRICQTRMEVPRPRVEPKPEPGLDVLQEVEVPEALDDLEEVEEKLDDLPVVDVWPPVPPAPKKRKKQRRLIIHGNNGSVELVGRDLVFDHDGTFGPFAPSVRPGRYRHPVLAITDIEIVEPGLLGQGRIRFVMGHERLAADVAYVLDTQTITFGTADYGRFLNFKREVERIRRLIIQEIRMNNQ
jgi:hypothetical protein